jgi:3-methyladenine DNA glycosylase Tag
MRSPENDANAAEGELGACEQPMSAAMAAMLAKLRIIFVGRSTLKRFIDFSLTARIKAAPAHSILLSNHRQF